MKLINAHVVSMSSSPNKWGAISETLYYRDKALSTKPVILIWAHLIPATRWSCSQQSLLSAGLTLAPSSSSDKGCRDEHHMSNYVKECTVS